VVLAGCSSDLAEPASISIAVSPTSGSVGPNGSIQVQITLTRAGGFAGSISLGVENLPSSVLASFSPAVVPGSETTATLTLQAGPAPGSGNNTIRVLGLGTTFDGFVLSTSTEFSLSIVGQ
jgi:hypothetical protein